MTTLAIDIGGTKLAAALIGADGQIRDRRELPTPASQTPEALRDALSALVSPLQAHAQRVAIASTGIIRDDSLQAAAWAEYQALEGDVTEMVFITVSTGVGGGVVSGGKLLTGPGGLAGHIGHTLADPHGPVCGCGRTGCVEAIASGRGIAAAAQGELAGADARTIFTRAGQGDEQAQQLIHRSARTLARLIADIKATTDCQCVVVGGSVGLAEGYLALVETYLAQEPAAFHVDLLAAHYRHDAGLLGAALLAQGEKL